LVENRRFGNLIPHLVLCLGVGIVVFPGSPMRRRLSLPRRLSIAAKPA
jgi:hypothetical protein